MKSRAIRGVAFWDKAVVFTLLSYFFLEVTSGATRYYLASLGIPWLAYFPKALILAILCGSLLKALGTRKVDAVTAKATGFLLFFSLVGWLFTGNPVQVGFGLFVLLPLVLGLLAEPTLTRVAFRALPWALALWSVAAIGVLYDSIYATPWAGFEYEFGGANITSNREWWTYGLDRVSGFSRASFDAADQLLFLGLFIVVIGRGWFWRTSIWLVSGYLIVLTTTKKAVGIFVILTVLLPLFVCHVRGASLRPMLTRLAPWALVAGAIFLPLWSLVERLSFNLGSPFSAFLLSSFEDRLVTAWPNSLRLIAEAGSLVLGRGVGGIGAAQSYFEPERYAFADNVFVYVYGTFGLTGLVLLLFFSRRLTVLRTFRRVPKAYWFLGVAVIAAGWAANGLEGGTSSLVLGLALRHVWTGNSGRIGGEGPDLPHPAEANTYG